MAGKKNDVLKRSGSGRSGLHPAPWHLERGLHVRQCALSEGERNR